MDADEEAFHPYKFERSVWAQVVGTLTAWFIGLLVFLMYRLWQDYISTILTAVIVSQTLHSHRARFVGGLQWLRGPTSPPLLLGGIAAVRQPMELARHLVYDVPPLVQLSMLLVLFLVHNVYSWAQLGVVLLPPLFLFGAAVVVLDKRLLKTHLIISDEVLAACLVIGGLISVLAFVVITLAVQSVVESVYLLVAGSTWMRDVSTDAAAPVRALVAEGVELGVAGLESLKRAEHQWVPVVSHLLEQIGSSNLSNGTVVVMSTFEKLRECYPTAAWVGQAEDLSRHVLWASGAASVAATGDAPYANATTPNATTANATFTAMISFSGFAKVRDQTLKLLYNSSDEPTELLTILRARAEAAWPAFHSTVLGSQYALVALLSRTLTLMLQLAHVLLAFGSTTAIFLTMTFYMLSAEQVCAPPPLPSPSITFHQLPSTSMAIHHHGLPPPSMPIHAFHHLPCQSMPIQAFHHLPCQSMPIHAFHHLPCQSIPIHPFALHPPGRPHPPRREDSPSSDFEHPAAHA